MFSAWRNRLLLDYAQWIIDHPLTREMGAPIDGEGPVYFSAIDDSEIEICKALWEGNDYLRIPPPRRIWNSQFCNDFDKWRDAFWRMANALADGVERIHTEGIDKFHLPVFGRGIQLVLAAQAVQLKSVTVGCYKFPYAVEQFLEYAIRRPEISYIKEVLVW